jgi:hypothetical protein
MKPHRRHLALLMSLLLISGHSAGLQVLAWGGMFVDNLGRMSVAQALQRAVAPATPCRICRVIAVLRTDQNLEDGGRTNAPATMKAIPKPDLSVAMDLILPASAPVHTRRSCLVDWRLPPDVGDQPPVPPPQG